MDNNDQKSPKTLKKLYKVIRLIFYLLQKIRLQLSFEKCNNFRRNNFWPLTVVYFISIIYILKKQTIRKISVNGKSRPKVVELCRISWKHVDEHTSHVVTI